MFRKLKVFLDDKQLGTVGWKDTLTADLTPGNHTVAVKMDWIASPPLAIVAGDVADLHVAVDAGNPLMATLLTFTLPHRVLSLRLR
jgi:hypothetical protein